MLTAWREAIEKLPSAKGLDRPTLNDHIPAFLEDLACALDTRTNDEISAERLVKNTPPDHGLQRLHVGFQVEEVVEEYKILRDCIHDLADRHDIHLQGRLLRILNHAVDGAIAGAVRSYVVQQALDIRHRREDYLAFVAHDLRTPLNAVSLAAQMLEKMLPEYASNPLSARAFKTLNRNIGYLTASVSKILEENANLQTESGIKLARRKLDLWPLIESLIYDLHPVAGTGSTRMINNVADDMTVIADAALLRRVFQNLIANALNYTPQGKVVISARRSTADDGVICEVSDNGAGIPEHRLQHIFEKFETDNRTTDAIGLGLTICKTFVEAHGGTITVESNPGAGSTFRFVLPD